METTVVQAIEKKGPVHLRFDDGKLLITPEDHPRFIMAAKRAVRVLQQEKTKDEHVRQFYNHYLPFLHSWCVKNRDLLRACYVGTPSPHGLTVFIIGKGKYDFALGDEISRFALQLEQEGWPSNILQIPDGDDDDLLTFFNPESALEVYAKTEAASGKGGA